MISLNLFLGLLDLWVIIQLVFILDITNLTQLPNLEMIIKQVTSQNYIYFWSVLRPSLLKFWYFLCPNSSMISSTSLGCPVKDANRLLGWLPWREHQDQQTNFITYLTGAVNLIRQPLTIVEVTGFKLYNWAQYSQFYLGSRWWKSASKKYRIPITITTYKIKEVYWYILPTRW